MLELVTTENRIPAMNSMAIGKVRTFEDEQLQKKQTVTPFLHTLHGGVYTRSCLLPAGMRMTGALIKIATTLIISGDVLAYIGETAVELKGYNVLAASAGRKQAFVALTDTYMTMLFATSATSVAEAEEEFTDEAERLSSRREDAVNKVVITGE